MDTDPDPIEGELYASDPASAFPHIYKVVGKYFGTLFMMSRICGPDFSSDYIYKNEMGKDLAGAECTKCKNSLEYLNYILENDE